MLTAGRRQDAAESAALRTTESGFGLLTASEYFHPRVSSISTVTVDSGTKAVISLGSYLQDSDFKEYVMATAIKERTDATVFTMPSDRELTVTRVIDAPRSLVFDAWTRSEHPRHFLMNPTRWIMPVCEIDLRPGGEWHYVWQRIDGSETMEMRGIFKEIVPPLRLVTEEFWGEEMPETTTTMILTENEGKTTLSMTMLFASQEARDAAFETEMKEGMSDTFDCLEAYLQTLK
jgi:uncharacterized protein YndB with AHSA1/START domain